MGFGFLLRRAKGLTCYQTTGQKWSMTRSQRATPLISLAHACSKSAQTTKRAPRVAGSSRWGIISHQSSGAADSEMLEIAGITLRLHE
jgi:hypothetical protein